MCSQHKTIFFSLQNAYTRYNSHLSSYNHIRNEFPFNLRYMNVMIKKKWNSEKKAKQQIEL